jgi:hypothetical protein
MSYILLNEDLKVPKHEILSRDFVLSWSMIFLSSYALAEYILIYNISYAHTINHSTLMLIFCVCCQSIFFFILVGNKNFQDFQKGPEHMPSTSMSMRRLAIYQQHNMRMLIMRKFHQSRISGDRSKLSNNQGFGTVGKMSADFRTYFCW